jgi:Predicted membrane protein
MNEFLLIVLAYLIGSIPSSVWVSKYFFGIDIRDYGSGNAGATIHSEHLARTGVHLLWCRYAKGIIAVKLVYLIPYYLDHESQMTNLQIGLGLAAVVGHIFPIWAEFRGGKGVATVFGMVLGIQPIVAVCCVGVFLFVLYLTRFVSLSSILASVAFPIFILVYLMKKKISIEFLQLLSP